MALKREIKISAQKVNSSLEQEDSPESYRKGMLVTEVMVFETWFRKTGYYVCPHCKITMDREFMPFCDRCGQKLDWRYYRKAKIVYPDRVPIILDDYGIRKITPYECLALQGFPKDYCFPKIPNVATVWLFQLSEE